MTDKSTKIHPCEPSLDELKALCKKLMGSPSTDDNMKKIETLEKQIARHEQALSVIVAPPGDDS